MQWKNKKRILNITVQTNIGFPFFFVWEKYSIDAQPIPKNK